ncbi:regulatory protein RecX [Rubellimicrobium rubrum]|uniref:Regulatory protein RecX n=1 Tax=Rubellimicrobium rubrum TaxID=2585369 RepID=A0A5C4MU22_9RHOB|nr:regulatory protein RecX [Rubellimicrobium rubrum]TNC49121.1 regulatory protein RecX [Rubellimicrobium rubrum]
MAPRFPPRGDQPDPRDATKPSQGPAAAKPLTAARIRNIAEHYVGQRESSAQMLRDVLERRLLRRLRSLAPEVAAEERATALALIDAEIARLQEAGIIQDARYAEMKARTALSSGRGARRILQDLARKGVEQDTARGALLEAAREMVDPEETDPEGSDLLRAAEAEAADVFARKRRFGPYRTRAVPEDWSERSKLWRKEAAAMVRAGFGADTIRRVLDRAPDEE